MSNTIAFAVCTGTAVARVIGSGNTLGLMLWFPVENPPDFAHAAAAAGVARNVSNARMAGLSRKVTIRSPPISTAVAGAPDAIDGKLNTLKPLPAFDFVVDVITLPTKSLLNRCVSNRAMPFTWTINPYRGCEFGCRYCYARYTHEFMELRDPLAFEQKIYVKQNVAGQLRRDLRKVKKTEMIAIGTATDPYQPAERRYEMTRAILEEFANHAGYDLGIVTKSDLVVRDAELLRRIGERNKIYVNLTVTNLDCRLARLLEPRAPRPDLRFEAVRRLREAGKIFCGGEVRGCDNGSEKSDWS